MITLYAWSTPNGLKPMILLEELDIKYNLTQVNLGADEQHRPEFLAINPNGKIPALVDDEVDGSPIKVFESGAILQYLAEKTGKFLPISGQPRADTLSWLMFQMGGVGPMFGQAYHFSLLAKEKVPYAIDRYVNEVIRLCQVLEGRLSSVDYLAGDYSIADMATWPWIYRLEGMGISWNDYPHIKRWVDRIAARPAVQRAVAVKFGQASPSS